LVHCGPRICAEHILSVSFSMTDDKHMHDKKRETAQTSGAPRVSKPRQNTESSSDSLIIVGIGSSAGGLDALKKMLPTLPMGVGMAYVVVQHLAPKHHSSLPQLLAGDTDMKVKSIEDNEAVLADTLYISPPNYDVRLAGGRLELKPPAGLGPKPSIDSFFLSLAEEKKVRAVGIVLSGTGSDGTQGVRAIKSEEGITIAQTVESAGFDSMPRSAVETGLVDMTVDPEEIGEALQAILQYPRFLKKNPAKQSLNTVDAILKKVHQESAINFGEYKRSTIHRRINRRMAIARIAEPEDYLSYLQATPEEARALARDMLISVTGFFRDGDAFVSLKTHLTKLLAAKNPGDTFRAWVPGCATGEEAYSIAIIIAEILGDDLDKYHFQIFATDIDDDAIQQARRSAYPAVSVMETDKERFDTYFTRDKETVTVNKSIRNMVVLAKQDLLKDTSFLNLDLISCRNLLIYLESTLQDRLLTLFHFSLRENGLLFLGKSESIGQRSDLFTALDNRWKIYRQRQAPVKRLPDMLQQHRSTAAESLPQHRGFRKREQTDYREGRFFDSLMQALDCCALLVDNNFNVLYIRGDISPYFSLPEGTVRGNLNLLDLARKEVRYVLQPLMRKVVKQAAACTSSLIVMDEGRGVRLRISPIDGDDRTNTLLVVCMPEEIDRGTVSSRAEEVEDEEERGHIRKLEQELAFTQEHLQDTIEELETSTEELQALNEELQSSNEELQATNEELETSNEELQASNEELNTVNEELRAKSEEAERLVEEISESEGRYRKLIENMSEGLMLCTIDYDPERQPCDLVIQQINRSAETLFKLDEKMLPVRAGAARLLEMVEEETLGKLAAIADNGRPQQFELYIDSLGRHLRLSAYAVEHNVLGLVCHDISKRKKAELDLRESQATLKSAMEAMNDAVFIVNADADLIDYNTAFISFHRFSEEENVATSLKEIESRIALRREGGEELEGELWPVRRALAGERASSVTYTLQHRNGDESWVGSYSYSPFGPDDDTISGAVIVARDITEMKRAEEALVASEKKYRQLVETANSIILRWDSEGRINFVNSFALRTLGYEESELIGSKVTMLVPEREQSSGRDLTGLARQIIAEPDKYTSYTNENITKEGRIIWVAWTNKAIVDDEGRVLENLAIGNDITTLMEMEKALQHSQYLLEKAQEMACLGSWEHHMESGTLSWSEQIYRIFGLETTATAPSYELLLQAVHAEDREMVDRVYSASLEGDLPYDVEHRIVRPDGEIRYLHQKCEHIRDPQGTVLRSVGMAHDITEQHEAKTALLRSNRELEQFAYVASHDLKEPLRAISGFLQLLQKKYAQQLDEQGLGFIDRSVKASARMHRLISELLELSRISSQGEAFTPTDLNAVYAEVQESLTGYIEETNARIDCAELPVLTVDAGQIHRLLQNLIGNGLKYNSSPQPRVSITCTESDGSFHFTVRDNGIGIDERFHERVFVIFKRLHNDDEYKGTGMGLTICKKIVERHGGSIWIESVADGTIVHFTLPKRSGSGTSRRLPLPRT